MATDIDPAKTAEFRNTEQKFYRQMCVYYMRIMSGLRYFVVLHLGHVNSSILAASKELQRLYKNSPDW